MHTVGNITAPPGTPGPDPPLASSSTIAQRTSSTTTLGNVQDVKVSSLDKLKEAVDAQLRSQLKSRPKSKLDQAETASTSPPAPMPENGHNRGMSSNGSTSNKTTTASSTFKKMLHMPRPRLDGYETALASSSYPFPQMPIGRGLATTISPSVGGPQDRPLPSGSATPSSFAFMPTGTTPFENPDFPTPNMYELGLNLYSEPGLDAFWSNLVKIFTTVYKAERLSLTIPTDSTDLENSPWGQKATYSAEDNDALSLTYMGDGGVGDPETEGTEEEESSDEQTGVPIPEEYSQTKNGKPGKNTDGQEGSDEMRDDFADLSLEGDYGEPFSPIVIGMDQKQAQDASSSSDWVDECDGFSPAGSPKSQYGLSYRSHPAGVNSIVNGEYELKGRVFPVLQPLAYEADALLDGAGVIRVLKRGKTVVLSREYRDIQTHLDRVAAKQEKKDKDRVIPWSTNSAAVTNNIPLTPGQSKREKMHISLKDIQPPTPGKPPSEPPTPLPFVSKSVRRNGKRISGRRKNDLATNPVLQFYSSQQHQMRHSRSHSPSRSLYEEYEQPLSSPWSQSPAPSPAIKPDPADNPFFAPARVDEDCFNPTGASPIYSAQEPVHAIGMENASTVIHIPLVHPAISKLYHSVAAPVETQRLSNTESAKGKGKFTRSAKTPSGAPSAYDDVPVYGERKAPIAILSMLSPVIPYPSSLVHSLSHFAPMVATAFALAQAHDNILTQLSHHKRKRRRTSSYPLGTYGGTILSPDRASASVTSPSDYSSLSRLSNPASRVHSPNVELGVSPRSKSPGSLVSTPDTAVRVGSPGAVLTDSYFTSKRKSLNINKVGGATPKPRPGSKGWHTHDVKVNGAGGLELKLQPGSAAGNETAITTQEKPWARADTSLELSTPMPISADEQTGETANPEENLPAVKLESSDDPPEVASRPNSEHGLYKRARPSFKRKTSIKRHGHTVLHSYGADYSATFQSLSVTGSEPSTPDRRPSLATKLINVQEMPPPSSKLLRTIIDSIPVHVFTAAPITGITTWVNARMLAYRGSSVHEFLRDPWSPFHPEDRGEYRRLWKMAVDAGMPFSHQVRIRRFDGVYRWFMIRAVPLRDTKGGIVHWFGTNMDIHDQRVAEINAARQQEMAESEQKYRSLANSSPQIVFAATADEGITFANTQWETYSGQTLEQTLHLGFMEFVHPGDRAKCSLPGLGAPNPIFSSETVKSPGDKALSPDVRSPDLDVKSPGGKSRDKGKFSSRFYEIPDADGSDGTFSTELRLRRKDGHYRWHLVRCVRVESNFGRGEGQWFGTCTDINDHKLLEQRLKEANEAAQKSMESKTRFLANMSHEIRTPLIGISGMVNFLLDTPLSGEQLDYCHTISQSSEGLLMVINDILDLSKVEAGMMRLNSTWFRIHTLIEDANELLSTMAIQKHLELNYIVEENVPLVVGGDRVRLRQVLLNVIGNAIKFTSTGEVFSRCSVITEAVVGDDEVMLQFECHDTGPGFDKKEEELIFKPFSQIDGSSTRAHGGSGLGLVISRQLVELHGGTMTARSIKGKGSMFVFSAIFKVPPAREDSNNDNATARIEDDHILDKGFSESPSNTSPGLSFGGTESVASSATSERASVNSFVTTSDSSGSGMTIQHMVLSDATKDPASMCLSLPPEIQDKVRNYSSSNAEQNSPDIPEEQSDSDSAPAFNILVLSELVWSLHAISHHIRMTLPKNSSHHIELTKSIKECTDQLNSSSSARLTHLVINLPDHLDIISVLDTVLKRPKFKKITVLILTNPMQRTAILEGAPAQCRVLSDKIRFIYKPLKPSKFGVVFDPAKENDASMDRSRDSAQQVVESQKRVFTEMEKDVGNKGHRVLLVEDNPVNQKVLLRFLARVALEVEIASDGEECVSKVFSNGSGHYALILCDLHMPRKDGFQACTEIRQWEKARKLPPVPIIALSANVMSDVADRCASAGFSCFVAKPVDFETLSTAMKQLLDSSKSHNLMSQQQNDDATPSSLAHKSDRRRAANTSH